MKRISRDKVQAAGVIVGGLALLVGVLALLTTGGGQPTAHWTPNASLLQPNMLQVGELDAPRRQATLGAAAEATADPEAGNDVELASAEAELRDLELERLRDREQAGRDEDEEPGTGVLTGLVTDRAGTPLADVAVQIRQRRRGRRNRDQGQALEVRTDAMGRFAAEVPSGRLLAWAKGDGFAPSERARAKVEPDGEVDAGTLILLPACALTGQVVDAQGLPLAGAKVKVKGNDGEQKVETDEEGRFRVDELAEGLYKVKVKADGYVDARQREVPVSEQHGGEVALTLERAGLLEGHARLAGGEPLVKGRVFVYRGGRRLEATRTNDEGRYQVEDLEPGPIEVFARSEDFSHTCRVNGEVKPGGLTVLDLLLDEGARIVGTVTDPSGEPLEGIEVRAHSIGGDVAREGQSDAEGRYTINNLYPGDYRLFVPQEGRRELKPRIEQTLHVSSGEHLRELVLPVGAVYAGTVVDPAGQPVEGAWVFAVVGEEHRGRTESDEEGRFRVEGLHAGEYQIFVRVDGDRLVSVSPLRLGADQTLLDQRIVVRPPARLRGRVLDASGQPLSGIEIRVESLEHPVERDEDSDESGAFELGPLYDGDYRLTIDDGSLALLARQRGAETATSPPMNFTVREGRDASLDIVIQVSGPTDLE